jgi:uncharacterized SAM-binding protein YcdF (DUF218 family)
LLAASQRRAAPGGDSRWRRRAHRLVVSVCLLLIVVVIAGLPVFVRPQIDRLRHADAILILGGFGDYRYSFGLELAAQGWAPDLVVSNPRGASDVWERNFCATPPTRLDLHCFMPDPITTKGEARELRRLASQYGWRTVIVVTFQPHISRARFILEQCFDGDLIMVASPAHIPPPRWAFEYVYQTAGYVRAMLQPGC